MLMTGQFPDKWEKAQVIPITTGDSPSEYKHYRPIALLYHLGKLSEQVIVDKMCHTINAVITPGSMHIIYLASGTNDVLLQYVDDLTEELSSSCGKFVRTAFPDFSKALDRLQPCVVIDKMVLHGLYQNIVNLVNNLLKQQNSMR